MRLQPFLSDADFVTVAHAFVIARLDHCSVLYIGLNLKSIQNVRLVQNVPC